MNFSVKFMNLLPKQTLTAVRFIPIKGIPSYLTSVKNMATSATPNIKSVTYNQLKEYQKSGTTIIDVREKQELLETGTLPKSTNIPVGEVETALQLSDDEFIKRFGVQKPEPEADIIFSCRSGRRSEMAAITAVKLGFKKVFNYSGGWLDWENNNKGQN